MKISIPFVIGACLTASFAARPALAVWPASTSFEAEKTEAGVSTKTPAPPQAADRLKEDERRLAEVVARLEEDEKRVSEKAARTSDAPPTQIPSEKEDVRGRSLH